MGLPCTFACCTLYRYLAPKLDVLIKRVAWVVREVENLSSGYRGLFWVSTWYIPYHSVFRTSVKLGEISGVELVSTCEAYATTPLDFLWHNI